MTRSAYLSGAAILALSTMASVAPAWGQEGRPVQADGAVSGDAGVVDIVVTAQRRSESMSKTPLAISAVSAATLQTANVTQLTALSRLVPAVQIVQAAGATPIYFVRGVGSLSGNSLADPAISINYDGVALARQYQGNGQFYDLERVEMLRGPQGTLYGRNSTAGVINIVPSAPKLDETSARGSFSYGDYDAINVDAAVNVALGDEAALRIAGQLAQHDGYLNDGQQDQRDRSLRAQLLVEPNDTFKIKVGVDYHHQGGVGGGYALVDQSNYAGYPAGTALITPESRAGYLSPRGQQYFAARGRGTPTDPVNPHLNNDFWGVNAKIDLDLGFATLTAIPAYRSAKLDYYAINSFSIGVREDDEQYSLETRLASNNSHGLHWIVGAMGLSDTVRDRTDSDNYNLTGLRQQFVARTRSWGVFADGTYDLTDTVRLLGGVRYTEDNKTATGLQTNLPGTGNFLVMNGDETFSATNYRVGLQYDVTPGTMFYATVSTGYHAGGFFFSDPNSANDLRSYRPERITAYTAGVKTRFLDNKVSLDLEIFRWDLRNQQLSIFTQNSATQTIFVTLNAGGSRNQGAEFNLTARPFSGTLLGAQVQYLDAGFSDLVYTQAIPVQPGFLCSTSGAAPTLRVNCSGQRPPQAPEWTLNLSGEQTIALPGASELVVGARAHFQTKTVVGFNYLIDDVQKAYWTEDAYVTFNPAGKRWSIGAFINNITDEAIKSNATHNANVQAFQLRPPRTYGVRVGFDF